MTDYDTNDLISRKLVIESIKSIKYYGDFVSTLINLPSVNAIQVVNCKNCIYYGEEPCGRTVNMCYRGLGWTNPDDYCSKAVRKTNCEVNNGF